jgi:hypothetical protein
MIVVPIMPHAITTPGPRRWVSGGWLLIVAGCLAGGFATGWSTPALEVIIPAGVASFLAVPPAVEALGPNKGPRPKDHVKVIYLPEKTDFYKSPNSHMRVVEYTWRIAGNSEEFEIVGASFRRRWQRESIVGHVHPHDNYVSASFQGSNFLTRGTVTLVDTNGQSHRYSVAADTSLLEK